MGSSAFIHTGVDVYNALQAQLLKGCACVSRTLGRRSAAVTLVVAQSVCGQLSSEQAACLSARATYPATLLWQ